MFPSSSFKKRQNNRAQSGKAVNTGRKIKASFPGRAGPSTSTATQNNNSTKKNLIQNYIIKRNVSNNESKKNLKMIMRS